MIVMTPEAGEREIEAVKAKLATTGVHVLVLPGELTTAIASVCAARTRNVSDMPRKNVTISTATHRQKAAEATILRPCGQCESIAPKA